MFNYRAIAVAILDWFAADEKTPENALQNELNLGLHSLKKFAKTRNSISLSQLNDFYDEDEVTIEGLALIEQLELCYIQYVLTIQEKTQWTTQQDARSFDILHSVIERWATFAVSRNDLLALPKEQPGACSAYIWHGVRRCLLAAQDTST